MFNLTKINGQHSGQNILTAGRDIAEAQNALIMLHGRGATAADILSLKIELKTESTFIAAPQAADNSWYPHGFTDPRQFNEPHIQSGFSVIEELIKAINANGISSGKIILFGFSQGACLVLDYLARNPQRLGGVIALSGGLIGDKLNYMDYQGNLEGTPLFIGCGDNDPHISVSRMKETAKIFKLLNAQVFERIYENLGHTINSEEIERINKMLGEVQ